MPTPKFWRSLAVMLPAAAALFLLPQHVHAEVNSGLISSWHMDADSIAGQVLDSIGSNTSSFKQTTVGVAGIASPGTGYNFQSGSDRIELPTNGSIETSAFSVQAWIYPISGNGVIWTYAPKGAANDARGVLIKMVSGNLECNVGSGSGTWSTASTNSAMDLNVWHNFVCTYSSGVVKLYLDDFLVSSVPAASGLSYTDGTGSNPNSKQFFVGNSPDSMLGSYYTGRIDELKFYNRALSINEILVNTDTLNAGILAHWHFDEPSWNGTSGEVVDSVGAYNGTSSSATTVADGKINGAGSFNGSNFVSVPDSPNMELRQTTYNMWIRTSQTSTGYGSPIMYKAMGGDGSKWGYWIQNDSGHISALTKGNNGSGTQITSASSYADGTWHMVTMTYDYTNNRLALYVDGALQGTSGVSDSGLITTDPLYFGYMPDHFWNSYVGDIDEPMVYTRPLNMQEVAYLYQVQVNWGNAVPTSGTQEDAGYYSKVIQKTDGNPLMFYVSLSLSGGHDTGNFIGCADANCTSYSTTVLDTQVADTSVGSWGLLFNDPVSGYPFYISRNELLQGTLSVLKCLDVNCTTHSMIRSIFGGETKDAAFYGYLAGALRPDNKPFFVIDEVNSGVHNLMMLSCGVTDCTSSTTSLLSLHGNSPSVAVLSDGRPVVSYYDTQTYSLRIYVCANQACTSGSDYLLHQGDVTNHYGEVSAIITRNDGTPGISYSSPKGLRFYDCPNANCTGGSVATNSYSVHDEGNGYMTGNISGSMVQLDTSGNPIILNTTARRKGTGNVSIYYCYNPKCSEGRFRTLVKDSNNKGAYGSLLLRNDGGYVIPFKDITDQTANFYDQVPAGTSRIIGLPSSVGVRQVSRVNPLDTVSQNDGNPEAQNFATSVVDLRVLKSTNSAPISDVTVSFSDAANMDWSTVSGDSDSSAGKAVISNLGTAPGTDSTHTLYVPKRAQDSAVHICPGAHVLADLTLNCAGGYNLSANGGAASIVTINGVVYWKITGLSGTGGLGVAETNGGIGLTLTPNNMNISTTNEIIAHWSPSGEFAGSATAAIDFPTGFTIANCTSATVDADGDATPDGAGTITSVPGYTRFLYTFTASTTTAAISGLNFCIRVTSPATAANYQVNAYDSLGGFGAAFLYVGDENTLNIIGTVDNSLSFVIRNTADTADQANVGGLSLGPNLCDLGDLSNAGVQSCSYRLKISTNAGNGYTVTMQTDGSLRRSNDTDFIPNIASGGTVTAGTAGYGITIDPGRITSNPLSGVSLGASFVSLLDNPTATAVTTGINSTLYTATSGNNPTSTDTVDTAIVTHRAESDASTPAGTYKQLVTYTVSTTY